MFGLKKKKEELDNMGAWEESENWNWNKKIWWVRVQYNVGFSEKVNRFDGNP